MIEKLEKTSSNAHQNEDQHRTTTNNGRYIKQQNKSKLIFAEK